jgi:hypothetical protein
MIPGTRVSYVIQYVQQFHHVLYSFGTATAIVLVPCTLYCSTTSTSYPLPVILYSEYVALLFGVLIDTDDIRIPGYSRIYLLRSDRQDDFWIENQANLDEKSSESSHTLPISSTNASLRDTYTRLLSTAIYYY